jgi:hypothetical protein
MRKLFVLFALLLSLGCASTQTWVKAKYEINLKSVMGECAPQEHFVLNIFRIKLLALHFAECRNVEDVFAIVWQGDEPNEFEDKLVDVLMLEYVNTLNISDPNAKWGYVYITSDRDEEDKLNARFWYLRDISQEDEE